MNKQGGIMNTELIQALREDAEWAHGNEWETPITLGDHLDAAASALEAADKREEAQKWIPVGERLPTVSEYRNGDKFKSMDSNELVPFLVCCEDTEIPFRAFYDGKNWGDGWGKQNVTHWQPLPNPPKEEIE